jgi:LacI family transcriptional regulator
MDKAPVPSPRTVGTANRPTMADVAKMAGVSLKTVSRVINKEPNVSPETATKVRQAVEALGFRPNHFARVLIPGQPSKTIGLVIEDLADPFFSGVARGAEEVAHEHSHMLLIASSDGTQARERQLVESLLERRCDGLLLVPSSRGQDYLAGEVQRGTPIVFVDRPPGQSGFDALLIDNYRGAVTAVRHLREHGHSRIAMIGGSRRLFTAAERARGYEYAMQDIRQSGTGYPVLEIDTSDQAEEAADSLLSLAEPPTAIFAASNRASVGVIRALNKTPARLAIVGFGDLELAAHLATPLSVISHDPIEMGRQACRMLFSRLAGDTTPARQIYLPTTLVPRGSGEIHVSQCLATPSDAPHQLETDHE